MWMNSVGFIISFIIVFKLDLYLILFSIGILEKFIIIYLTMDWELCKSIVTAKLLVSLFFIMHFIVF